MHAHPIISVVMPVYNAERFLKEAIDSILAQTCSDFEFIIIDDGSTDRSSEILRRAAARDNRIKRISRPNTGITPALNEAIGYATGKYIARMDADDISLPTRFEKQVAFLESHPRIVALGTQVERIDLDGAPLCASNFPTDPAEVEAALLGQRADRWPIAHPAVMMRRDVVEAVGRYNEQFVAAQDRELWLRLIDRGQMANLGEALLKFRCRPESISHATGRLQQSLSIEAIERACHRRGIPVPEALHQSDALPKPEMDYRYEWAKWALGAGHYTTARKHIWPLLRHDPFNWASIKVAIKASRLFALRRQLVGR